MENSLLRFTGNKLTGSWLFEDVPGIYEMLSVPQMLDDQRVVWIMTEKSGEFHWPHIKLSPNSEPQEMHYYDD